MNAKDRRENLLKWLEKEGTLGIAEMVDHFGVSKMTIHRDLDWLEHRQALKRIHGGAARLEHQSRQPDQLNQTSKEDHVSFDQSPQKKCLICSRPPSQQLLYTITLQNGEQQVACCPHCGISAHLMLGDKIAIALTADFLTGRLHTAQHSYFVLGCAVAHCCKPSILTFDDEEMARRFQIGFGGEVGRFNDALDFLKKDMSLHSADGCPHCASMVVSEIK